MTTVAAPERTSGDRGEQIAARVASLRVGRFALDAISVEDDSDPSIKQHVADLEAGHPLVFQEFAGVYERTRSLEVIPDKTIERRRSAHGVSFGRMMGRKSNNRVGNILSVAFKPFDRADKAVQEVHGYHVLRSLGMDTFEPVAVIPSEDADGFTVITRKRDDLMSLDRDEWVVGRQPRDERETAIAERNNRTVMEISSTLAFVHSRGVFHPDGQIKNFAINEYGSVGIIDTENLEMRQTSDPDNPAMAWNDIQKLVKSLIVESKEEGGGSEDKIFGVGMLANMGLPNLRSAFQELIMNPYIAELERLIEEGGDADYLTELAYSIQVEFDRDPNWPLNMVTNGKGA